MFQFSAFASASGGCRDRSLRVAPFGNPRITGHLPLPAAFRSLSRPSSPPRAQASPMRPCSSRYIFITTSRLHLASPAGEEGDDCSRLAFDFLIIPGASAPGARCVYSVSARDSAPRLNTLRCNSTRVASPACQCPCTFCPSGRRLSSREGSHCGSPWQS